jgi:chromate transport protein ChrA
MSFVKPAVVGLIGAAAVILILKTTWTGFTPNVQIVADNFPDWKSWVLLGGALAAGYWGKVNPIYLILAGAVLGIILY